MSSILERLFFAVGILNNLLLIAMFLARKSSNMALVRQIGIAYLFLAIPAIYGLFLTFSEQKNVRYAVFLGIFLAFLALEVVFEFILKVPFRQNWRLLTPYLLLYYLMNYGFVVMVWRTSSPGGIILLSLFIIQIIANIVSHQR